MLSAMFVLIMTAAMVNLTFKVHSLFPMHATQTRPCMVMESCTKMEITHIYWEFEIASWRKITFSVLISHPEKSLSL